MNESETIKKNHWNVFNELIDGFYVGSCIKRAKVSLSLNKKIKVRNNQIDKINHHITVCHKTRPSTTISRQYSIKFNLKTSAIE